ncbi:hypothetical protein HYZ41_03830 [archaeon]|nr:hypothetical protein [archaeon]
MKNQLRALTVDHMGFCNDIFAGYLKEYGIDIVDSTKDESRRECVHKNNAHVLLRLNKYDIIVVNTVNRYGNTYPYGPEIASDACFNSKQDHKTEPIIIAYSFPANDDDKKYWKDFQYKYNFIELNFKDEAKPSPKDVIFYILNRHLKKQ